MKIGLKISFFLLAVAGIIVIIAVGYNSGNPMIIQILGGNEVDIALKQSLKKNVSDLSEIDSGPKNYLPPLPKYSHLTEGETYMLENPSLSSDDSAFYRAFPDLIPASDSILSGRFSY